MNHERVKESIFAAEFARRANGVWRSEMDKYRVGDLKESAMEVVAHDCMHHATAMVQLFEIGIKPMKKKNE